MSGGDGGRSARTRRIATQSDRAHQAIKNLRALDVLAVGKIWRCCVFRERRLVDNGLPSRTTCPLLAVRLSHPGFAKRLRRDFANLRWVMHLLVKADAENFRRAHLSCVKFRQHHVGDKRS
jgi:hypothetical protein